MPFASNCRFTSANNMRASPRSVIFFRNRLIVPYDPDADVTASEPFDAMEFIRLIHEERDAS